MKKILIILEVVFSLFSRATELKVVFLEVKNDKGQTVFLEPGFPYAHVVLGRGEFYIHSHPRTGVSKFSEQELKLYGEPKETFFLSDEGLNDEVLDNALGKPYDSQFNWSDERFYCSELVAKAIGLLPEPMHFDPKLWPPQFQAFEGLPGISPEKIFKRLKAGAFLFE